MPGDRPAAGSASQAAPPPDSDSVTVMARGRHSQPSWQRHRTGRRRSPVEPYLAACRICGMDRTPGMSRSRHPGSPSLAGCQPEPESQAGTVPVTVALATVTRAR